MWSARGACLPTYVFIPCVTRYAIRIAIQVSRVFLQGIAESWSGWGRSWISWLCISPRTWEALADRSKRLIIAWIACYVPHCPWFMATKSWVIVWVTIALTIWSSKGTSRAPVSSIITTCRSIVCIAPETGSITNIIAENCCIGGIARRITHLI